MFTLLIVFASILVAGLGFWFYNKLQVSSLAEKIDDKDAVINALRSHVEENSNESLNLTPSVEQALSANKKKKKYNKKNFTKTSPNQQSPSKDISKKQKQSQNQPPRPRKNKPSKNS
jgi:Tfp pilus assembly protein PilO